MAGVARIPVEYARAHALGLAACRRLRARRQGVLRWLSCLTGILLTACSPTVPEERPTWSPSKIETMGTYYRIQVAGEEMGEERREAGDHRGRGPGDGSGQHG